MGRWSGQHLELLATAPHAGRPASRTIFGHRSYSRIVSVRRRATSRKDLRIQLREVGQAVA